jgi:Flp pilus assembly protein TadB
MISALLSSFGPQIAGILAALAALAGAFFYGRKKGGDAERKNTDLVKAQAEADKQRQVAADAKADAAANQAVAEAAQQRQEIETRNAALKPGEAQKELMENWSRD